MKFTNITLLDPILSISVAIFILFHSLKNLKEVIDIFLEITPKNIDIDTIKNNLLKVDGVTDVHHIHVRSIDGFNHIATLHIVVKEYDEKIKKKAKEDLKKYGIGHSTIELELEDEHCNNKDCILDNEHHHHHHHHHH